MPMSYDESKERYKAHMFCSADNGRLTYIATCIQCGLDTLLNLPFKTILNCVNVNKDCAVFTFGRLPSPIISCLTQDLEIIFRVRIRNTIIKNGQD
jgi:hypothetical protein